jgi:hypothetical protein
MKKLEYDNFRVEVQIPRPYSFSTYSHEKRLKEMRRNAEDIISQIKRHVDSEGASFEFDTKELCSFCNYEWEENPDTGAPQCCDAALREFNESKVSA